MKLSAEDAFRLYGDRVFSAAFSVTGNQADADDAVQDTYLRYCSYDKEFADEDHLRAWLLRVAINRARDQKRSFWEKHRVSWEDYMERCPLKRRRISPSLRRSCPCPPSTGR